MTKHYIDIVKKWAFVFAYDIGEDDVEEVGDWLEALNASRREIARACRVIMKVNKGFTYSNSDLRMSVVCIGHASSREQWWDTVAHEVDHLQNTILGYYDVEPGTEDAAWLQGFLVRSIVKVMHNAQCTMGLTPVFCCVDNATHRTRNILNWHRNRQDRGSFRLPFFYVLRDKGMNGIVGSNFV